MASQMLNEEARKPRVAKTRHQNRIMIAKRFVSASWLACALIVIGRVRAGAQDATAISNLAFHSSNAALNASFAWAKQQALAYVRPGRDSIGPWYEAALPGRNAFCMRD